MELTSKQSQRLVIASGVIASVALIILFIDNGIKKQILREAQALREEINNVRGSGGSQEGVRQAGGGTGLHGDGTGNHDRSPRPRLHQDRGDEVREQVQQNPRGTSEATRAFFNGDRTENRSAAVHGALSSIEDEGQDD